MAATNRSLASQTSFVSERYGIWTVEVKSLTRTGTLVETTARDEDGNLDDHGGLRRNRPSRSRRTKKAMAQSFGENEHYIPIA